MAKQNAVRYAIKAAGRNRIDMPDGCAESGARRHAAEWAAEINQPVAVYGLLPSGTLGYEVAVIDPPRRDWPVTFPPDARERLARHLYVTFCGTAPGWDDPTRAPLEGRDRWRERADEILAVIASKAG